MHPWGGKEKNTGLGNMKTRQGQAGKGSKQGQGAKWALERKTGGPDTPGEGRAVSSGDPAFQTCPYISCPSLSLGGLQWSGLVLLM